MSAEPTSTTPGQGPLPVVGIVIVPHCSSDPTFTSIESKFLTTAGGDEVAGVAEIGETGVGAKYNPETSPFGFTEMKAARFDL